jgi:hypothetical protein
LNWRRRRRQWRQQQWHLSLTLTATQSAADGGLVGDDDSAAIAMQ